MKRKIIRLSNNNSVDITKLKLNELYELHYEEEKYAANILKKMKPFSKERIEYLSYAYKTIKPIADREKELEKESGIQKRDEHKDIAYNIFKKVLKGIKKKQNIKVFEIGCGEGVLLKRISKIPNLEVSGCDIKAPKIKNVNTIKGNILDVLRQLNDSSIDILIADNVCEHFMKDEADTIYDEMYNKLNDKGRMILLIPNSIVGPSDITKKVLPFGSKAQCFHFMEQTYNDNIKLFRKHRLKTYKLSLQKGTKCILINNIFGIPDKIKCITEKVLKYIKIKPENKKRLFNALGYKTYIVKKY